MVVVAIRIVRKDRSNFLMWWYHEMKLDLLTMVIIGLVLTRVVLENNTTYARCDGKDKKFFFM